MESTPPLVGIVVLNYHEPVATAACIRSLLAREPATTRILWIENEAIHSRETLIPFLQATGLSWRELDPSGTALPDPREVGVVFNLENIGYAAGNNLGLRMLHRAGVPYAWVLNNDTELLEGSSADLLAAAQARPDIGVWATTILERGTPHSGGLISLDDFAPHPVQGAAALERHPLSYASGCSMFLPLAQAAEVGFIPESYFLYYEDTAFSFELRRHGHPPSAVEGVVVQHAGSLSSGHRSPSMEYYCRRNRWELIRRFFPEHLDRQRLRILYTFQKYFFRGRFDRILLEWHAYQDFRDGRLGRSCREFRASSRPAQ